MGLGSMLDIGKLGDTLAHKVESSSLLQRATVALERTAAALETIAESAEMLADIAERGEGKTVRASRPR